MQNAFRNLLAQLNPSGPSEPYPYQLRTADLLLSGHNVVMTAPTGAGKTWAALFPFIYAKQHQLDFADRVIYALPLRTLAASLYQSTQAALDRNALPTDINVSIQMGNQPGDLLFQQDIIFTTIDQLLSAYIGLPFGTSKSQANVPPGALIGAYVVIDEFHLLSYSEAFPTLLDMMDRLAPYTKFLLMTATASPSVLRALEQHIRGQRVALTQAELQRLPQRERTLTWSDDRLTAEEIVRRHMPGGKTLVVVNRVKRAQELYEAVDQLLLQSGRQLEHRVLHAQMFARHRQQAEEWALRTFQKRSTAEGILIATQVVEAGLDISADVLLTEHCPANALIQRLGRCARFPGEKGKARVYSLRQGDQRQFAPYGQSGSEGGLIMERTESWLQQLPLDTLVTPELEQALLEAVHEELDQSRIALVLRDLFLRRDLVTRSLQAGEANTDQLIRQIDSVSVIVHDQPAEIDLLQPVDLVSISRKSLHSHLRKLNLPKEELVRYVHVPQFRSDSYDDSPYVQWIPAGQANIVLGCTLVMLSPDIVSYREEVGLVLEAGCPGEKSGLLDTAPAAGAHDPYSYTRETYLEHVEKVRISFKIKQEACRMATKWLAKQFQMSTEQLARIGELAAALHDAGKLSSACQRQFRRWQAYKGRPENELLAHTDYDATLAADRHEYHAGGYKPPPHAVEGAAALAGWIGRTFQPQLAAGIVLAIARHHHAFSQKAEAFVFAKGALETVQLSTAALAYRPTLQSVKVSVKLDRHVRMLQDNHVLAWYWYVARRVRLADRESFAQI